MSPQTNQRQRKNWKKAIDILKHYRYERGSKLFQHAVRAMPIRYGQEKVGSQNEDIFEKIGNLLFI